MKRPPARCSSAPASTTRCRSTTGGGSPASSSTSSRSRTPTGSCGSSELEAETRSSASTGQTSTQQAAFEMGLDGARADVRAAGAETRRAGRRATPAGVQIGARAGMDDPLLPRPRDARPHGHRRGDRAGRRLQGQELADQQAAGRPRHRRRACTSRAAGCRATRPRSSSLPRSQSRVPGASR